ncbi:MAG: hypothetical protein CMG34_04510 [Candidatus Marinimicrobia bacterium]|jgi:hypothetical protein|nr:hypothetical protein [Candidatus Neomarinimicrobiota bacterium]
MQKIEPHLYGLSARTNLVQIDNSIGILIDRKSRIIMKDGHRIVKQAHAIQIKENKPVILITSAPVCSKTKQYLSANNILINSL